VRATNKMSSVRTRRSTVGRLVPLGAVACAMTVSAVPAKAYEDKEVQPFTICSLEIRKNELWAEDTPLPGPANGATVPVGTPVTFLGESSRPALTFSVASSPSLLSSPDIDSGPGSLQPGTSLYTFTSTKVAATPRTIYWAASFTLTPKDCEDPSTLTTPVRMLTVVSPSPTEAETTAKKKQEEEAAAGTGGVSLDGATIGVQSTHEAAVNLACTGTATCSGMLTLAVKTQKVMDLGGVRGTRAP
jgi:hypothetical protein